MHLKNIPAFDVALQVPGLHNVENALAAATVCSQWGVGSAQIALALNSFKGVKRRFEIHVNTDRIKYVDDYAHHPDELQACIAAARQLWPGMKVTGLFQPHLYSRTRDFADGFASALSELDEVVLLPIYPAREQPITGIDSQMLLEKIRGVNKSIVSLENVPDWAEQFREGVLITLGAGNIDLCVEPLCRILKRKSEGGTVNE
jgi:UDP-N-acetylmuramate--alanine ligase